MRIEKIVPDTSIIIEKVLSNKLLSGNLKTKKIIIHEAVLAELESQANKGRETGHVGLLEIEKIRKIANKKKILIEFKGARPGDFEIKFAKSGEIDSLIRELANKEKATLITADIVQSKVAKAKGIKVVLLGIESSRKTLLIDKYFKKGVKSIVLRENEKLSKEKLNEIILDLFDYVKSSAYRGFLNDKKNIISGYTEKYLFLVTKHSISLNKELRIKLLPKKNALIKENTIKKILKARNILVVGKQSSGKTSLILRLIKPLDAYISQLSLPNTKFSQYLLSNFSELFEIVKFSKYGRIFIDDLRYPEEMRFYSDIVLTGQKTLASICSDSPMDSLLRIMHKTDSSTIKKIDLLIYCSDKIKIYEVKKKDNTSITYSDGTKNHTVLFS